MADYITTYSKTQFSPINPKEEDILIEDIGHALSLMTRANGHFPEFYSVGQHCINCCKEAIARNYSNRVILACLLHDGSEAYLADITRPVKRHLSQYLDIEEVLQNAIYKKYLKDPLTSMESTLISAIDDAMLYHEFDQYMDQQFQPAAPPISSTPTFHLQPFKEVEDEYIALASKYASLV
ncbi:MAG: phosphohydrolase [Clostridium sp.]|nr:phosphohydrolase [Clostridium sp.]